MQLRFSTRFSPDMIRTAYAPVQVKAEVIGISSIKKIPYDEWTSRQALAHDQMRDNSARDIKSVFPAQSNVPRIK